MYSQRVVGETIDRWIESGRPEPVFHTEAECVSAVSYFDDLLNYDPDTQRLVAKRDPDKPVTATLTREEIAFIRNERFLFRVDFRYALTRYMYIKSADDKPIRPKLWRSQEILLDLIAEMEEKGWAILLHVLKSRRLGLSRISTAILLQRLMSRPERTAFMASATDEKTQALYSNMVDFTWERLPWWLRVDKHAERAFRFVEYLNHSRLTFQHGQQAVGIGRGDTPTLWHLSELAEFDQTKVSDLVDSSLLIATQDTPDTFGVLEGTARGMNNWWHHSWRNAKNGWPLGRSRLRPVFLPHFVGGLEPTPEWLRAHPVPPDYENTMMPWAKAHAEIAEEYVRSSDYLIKALGSAWRMPIEVIWWYEVEREAAIQKRRLNEFLQERPANDDEAFQSTNISVFDTETITFYRDHAHRRTAPECFGLRGPVGIVPARLSASDQLIDWRGLNGGEREIIPIRCHVPHGEPIDFELWPLRFEGWSMESDAGSIDKIYVWERPLAGFEYGFGVDTADGIDKDRTVIEGVRKGGLHGPTKQVVEYASGKMNAIDCWPWVLALATWYKTQDDTGRMQFPRLAIECRGHGDIAQNIIRMLGWPNFHHWTDNQIDKRQINLGQFVKLGVFTNSWWRSGMIEMIVKSLRDCEIEIHSPHFVDEMTSLQGDELAQQLRAGYGGHDDRIMAMGFILVSLYKWDIDYYRSAKIAAYSGRGPVDPIVSARQYARWAPGELEEKVVLQ